MEQSASNFLRFQLETLQEAKLNLSKIFSQLYIELGKKFDSIQRDILTHESNIIKLYTEHLLNPSCLPGNPFQDLYLSTIFYLPDLVSDISSKISSLTKDLSLKSRPNLLSSPCLDNLQSVLSTQGLIPQGHVGRVSSVLISSDNSKIFTCSKDFSILIWSVSTGQVEKRLVGHRDWVNCLKVSSDQKFLVSASGDRTVRLWSLETFECFHIFEGHQDWVNCVDTCKNLMYLVSGSKDTTIRVWNSFSKRQEFCLNGHSSWVNAVLITPDEKFIVSGSGDCLVKVWNFFTKRLEASISAHLSYVLALAISPSGYFLASGSSDCCVNVWRFQGIVNEKPFRIERKGFVSCVAFNSNGKLLVVTSSDGSLAVWNLERQIMVFENFLEGFVRSACFDREDRVLVGMESGKVGSWDWMNGNLKWLKAHHEKIFSAFIDPGQNIILTISRDSEVHKWNLRNQTHIEIVSRQIARLGQGMFHFQ